VEQGGNICVDCFVFFTEKMYIGHRPRRYDFPHQWSNLLSVASHSCCGPKGPRGIGISSSNFTYIFHTHMLAVLITSNVVHAWALVLCIWARIACKLGHLVSMDYVMFKTACVGTIVEM